MTSQRPRFPFARGGALAALTLAAALAACEANIPTAAEVDKADVASIEKVAGRTGAGIEGATYIVDSVVVSREQARGIASAKIAAVEVRRDTSGGRVRSQIHVTTRDAAERRNRALVRDSIAVQPAERPSLALRSDTITLRADSMRFVDGDAVGYGKNVQLRLREPSMADTKQNPLVFVDGVRADISAFRRLQSEKIESVEVVKGGAAIAQWGPEAVHGVIRITTKK